MNLTQTKCGKVRNGTQVTGALRYLGVPEGMLKTRRSLRQRCQGFWNIPVDYLAILETAKRLWKLRMLREHPDKFGGHVDRAVQLNMVWNRVKRSFARRGYTLY